MAEHALALETNIYGEGHSTERKPNTIPHSFSERLLHHDPESIINTTLPILSQECAIAPQLSLQSQETLLSPFRELPTEIITLIIVEAAGKRRVIVLTPKLHGFRCTAEIFLLTWVCSRWRQIILSIPSFWTSYKIRKPNSTSLYKSVGPMNDGLNELLLRSGSVAPLSFDVSGVDMIYSVLNTLVVHTSRWKNVSLRFLNSPQRALEVIHKQTTSFPNLEVLLISSQEMHIFKPGSIGKVFIHCPRLNHLDITSFHISEVLDLQHLTTLEIGVYNGASLALLLQRCPVLKTLRLSRSKPDPVSDSPDMVPIPSNVNVHHHHLKSLRVDYLDDGFAMTFWRNVSLPNLTVVCGDIFNHDGDQSHFSEFKQMLVDSQCVLEWVNLTWNENLQGSIESRIQGISFSPQSHAHCWIVQLDGGGPCTAFLSVPSYQIPCYHCC